MMFFPAHSKHMQIERKTIETLGKNVTVSFEPSDPDGIDCTCKQNDRPTVILCNPNALCYEQMVNYPHNFWLKYFMNHGNNVVVWNYRGYGSNKGSPCPNNIKRDGEAVVRFCVDTLKLTGRMAIYGRSLGGIVACHIGNHVEGIDLLIADRTLANLETLTKRKMYGKFIHHAFNFFSCGWEVDNDINFLESKIQCKVMTCDPSDDVIDLFSSLYTGVALRYYEKEKGLPNKVETIKHEIFYKDDLELFTAMKRFFEIYELLCLALKEEDKLIIDPKNHPGFNVQVFEEIKAEIATLNRRDNLNSKAAKEFTQNRMQLRHVNARNKLQQEYGVKERDFNTSLSGLFDSYVRPFRNSFASLNSGVMTLYDIFHSDHCSILEDLKLFIVFLEVYGTGRALKPDGSYVTITKRRQNSVKKIDLILTELSSLNTNELNSTQEHRELVTLLKSLSQTIMKGLDVIKTYLEEKLVKDGLDQNNSHIDDLESHKVNLDVENPDHQRWLNKTPETKLGFVMPIRCGHRGYPKEKDKEKKALDLFLHHNGFTSRSKCDFVHEESSEDSN